MKPLRWKLYTDGSKQGIYKRRGTTDLQDAILSTLQGAWHGSTSVFAIEMILKDIKAAITPTVLTADLLQLQDMGLVTIDQNPQFVAHTGWIVNLPGLEWRDCPCCGRVASFWPKPQPHAIKPAVSTPRKRGRPARTPFVSPSTTAEATPITTTLLTPEKLKAKFALEGKTFSGWAEDHGYTRQEVYRVVNGFAKANRGKAHRIAVELGLKAPSTDAD